MYIEVELDDQHYEKLRILQQATGRDAGAVLQRAIDELFAREQTAIGADALRILRKNGFVGCLHGDGSLSQDYKKELDWGHKR